jgi:hypothetical protein
MTIIAVTEKGKSPMSKCTEIREICGDYAFDVEYSENNRCTMFFNSMRNAKTVKRCIEVDDSVPNAATAVDFVEVVRCKDCKYYRLYHLACVYPHHNGVISVDGFCSYGERKEQG